MIQISKPIVGLQHILVVASLLLSAISCDSSLKKAENSQLIDSNWEFAKQGNADFLPAEVPGTVHTDLIQNNLIPDPFFGTNEADLQWIGKTNWVYKTTFDKPENATSSFTQLLRFHGLDTYADVFLNGEQILSANNMFRTWDVDVSEKLKDKNNELKIQFRNVFDETIPKWESAPFRLMAFPNNDQADTMIALYSRKAQYQFGWDWGPRLITSGIWKPIELIYWQDIRIQDVQVSSKIESKNLAQIHASIELESQEDQQLTLQIYLNETEYINKKIAVQSGKKTYPISFSVKNPKLWWSNGLGEAYLYKARIQVTTDQKLVSSKSLNIGIREIELVREKDDSGRSFYVKLNGVPVFMKGANHIPEDNFLPRVTEKHYRDILQSAKDANMNMIRVWGGGIYESDTFYDICDELGLLVWQDMIFACAMYPGDQAFLDNVYAEVIDNVKRIRNHPSLALYCGNNENEIAWWQWGWKEKYTKEEQKEYESDLKKLFYETIPNAIEFADGTRPYTPTSPISGYDSKSYNQGDAHYWGVWHGKEPFSDYDKNLSRFMSEYGFQSYPEKSTIDKFTKAKDRHLHSEVMLAHQRCMADDRRDKEYGNRLIQHYLETHFKQPKSFESYIYVSQLVQSYGMTKAIEAHRSAMPFTMGTLYWQINDCWPVASWSSIDYFGNKKAAHFSVRDLYKPILIVPKIAEKSIEFQVVSDVLNEVEATFVLEVWHHSKGLVHRQETNWKIPANTSTRMESVQLKELRKGFKDNELSLVYYLKNETRAAKRVVHLVEPKNLVLKKPTIQVSKIEQNGKHYISLLSDVFAKDVFLSTWKSSNNEILNKDKTVRFLDNYVNLFPNTPILIEYEGVLNQVDEISILSLVDTY